MILKAIGQMSKNQVAVGAFLTLVKIRKFDKQVET